MEVLTRPHTNRWISDLKRSDSTDLSCRQHAIQTPPRAANAHFTASMPQMFTFGIPNYFQFTFRRGPKTPVSLQSFGGGTSSPCGTLGKLPLELRTMVYRKVLRYEKWCIQEAQEFMDRHPPIMAGEAPYLEDNDAFLLRTCRTVYQEAVHILYGGNAFSFSKPEDIEKFAHFGMGNTPFGYYRTASESPSAVGDAPYGRLTMIRSLDLMFNGAQSTSWSSWCNFFYPPEKQPQSIGFPALERLCLDFSDWGLRAEDASKIRVCFDLSYHLRPLFSNLRVFYRGLIHFSC